MNFAVNTLKLKQVIPNNFKLEIEIEIYKKNEKLERKITEQESLYNFIKIIKSLISVWQVG